MKTPPSYAPRTLFGVYSRLLVPLLFALAALAPVSGHAGELPFNPGQAPPDLPLWSPEPLPRLNLDLPPEVDSPPPLRVSPPPLTGAEPKPLVLYPRGGEPGEK